MNQKVKVFLITIGVTAIFSTGSFVAGREITHRQILSAQSSEEQIQQSTDIAIVNQDMGVDYNEKSVNYAADLIKSVDNDFVLTNREAAKKGLEDGKYGAMIVLPGNFSKNIISINDVTPSKVEIYYEENKDLQPENKLTVSAKISDFEKKLNSKLSYMYVSSVFDELHKGQDYVDEIMQNDDQDLEALNSINNFDILESINLTELEKQDIDIEKLDLNKNFSENKEVIEQIDTLYRDRLLAKEKSFDDIKDELLDVVGDKNDGIKSFRSKIEDMTPEQLKEALTKKHIYNYSSLSNDYKMNTDEVEKYIDEFTKEGGNIDNLVGTYKNSILDELDKKGKNSTKQINENMDKTINIADASIDAIERNSINNLNSIQGSIGSRNESNTINVLKEEYVLYGDIISELIRTNPGIFEGVYKNAIIRNNASCYKILVEPSSGMKPGNTFSDWNALKTYIINNSVQDDSFTMHRAQKYLDADNALSNNNVKLIEDSIDDLKNIESDLIDLLKESQNLKNDSDYKYMNDLFNIEDVKPIEERLKLNELLTKEIKINMMGEAKDNLLKTIEDNNAKVVDDTKEKVEKEVEQVIIKESPIDINKVLEIFDENYMARFSNLIEMTDDLDKTEEDPRKDSEVSNLWEQYDSKNEELNTLVTNQIDKYDEAFDKIKEEADNHVTTMQDDLDNGIDAAKQQIDESLEDAKNTKINSCNSNREKLNSLSSVLSNTRVGTVENSNIYNFIIEPVSTIKTQDLAAHINKNVPKVNINKRNDILFGLLAVFCTGTFLSLSLVYVFYKKIKSIV